MPQHDAENDAPRVTYSVEGYSTAAPVAMHNFTPYWGGYSNVEQARQAAEDLGNPRHCIRIVKVTREVVEYVLPPERGDDAQSPTA